MDGAPGDRDGPYCVYEVAPRDSTAATVVDAVADVTGGSTAAMNPLSTVVDPEVIDSLFRTPRTDERRTGVRLGFTYEECDVVVTAERVYVSPPVDRRR